MSLPPMMHASQSFAGALLPRGDNQTLAAFEDALQTFQQNNSLPGLNIEVSYGFLQEEPELEETLQTGQSVSTMVYKPVK